MKKQNENDPRISLLIYSRTPTSENSQLLRGDSRKHLIQLSDISTFDVNFSPMGNSVVIELSDDIHIRIDKALWDEIKRQDK